MGLERCAAKKKGGNQMKKWRVGTYDRVPMQYEVVKETAKMIVYKSPEWNDPNKFYETKEFKQGKWFGTWDEAHKMIIDKISKKINDLKGNLEIYERYFDDAMKLRMPEGADK
jgi:hypothetical protein